MSDKKTVTIKDVGRFTIQLTASSHWCNWEVFFAVDEDPRRYPRSAGAHAHDSDPTETIDDARSSAHGSVKWDGCSETMISEHMCEPHDLEALLDAVSIAVSDAWRAIAAHPESGVDIDGLLPDGKPL